MAEGLFIERRGHTLVATVDRGEENRFTPAMVEELADAITAAAREPAMRFVRLRARGPVFCLGREGAGPGAKPSADAIRSVAAGIVRLNELCQTTPLVVVAEVQGDAAGFGAGLVGNADVAVASEDVRLSFPEILAGYAPAIVMSWLPGAVPRKRAFDLVATGRWTDARAAQHDGLLTEVVAPESLERRVDERIEEMSRLSAPGLRDVKAFLGRTRGMDPASAAQASIDSLVVGSLRE